MKHLYKILFSLCSTMICAFYSARSFAASCTLYSSLPSDACWTEMQLVFEDSNCKTSGTMKYIALYKSKKFENGVYKDCTAYAGYQECLACYGGDEYVEGDLSINSELTKNCTISHPKCIPNGDVDYTVDDECDTDSDCARKFGASSKKVYFTDENGTPYAYAVASARCIGGSVCGWSAAETCSSGYNAICTNGHYGYAKTVNNSGKHCAQIVDNDTYVTGCSDCPTPSEDFGSPLCEIENFIDGEGTHIGSCWIKPGCFFEDFSGIFVTDGGNCKYK